MDFDGLLAEAIAYCQANAGDIWTDYNEHDPGLTILEQLCYALTDLGLRSRYPVEDWLADARGHLPRDTLFTGDRILSSAPITVGDYRKWLYSEVHGLKNAWLVPQPGMPGLYRVLIEKYRWGDDAAMIAQTSRLLRSRRLLCEDVAEVVVLQQQPLPLAGTISMQDGCDADQVMAALLFDLDLKLLPAPTPQLIDTQLTAGVPRETIYQGPSLDYGVINDDELVDLPASISLQQVARIVQGVAGVRAVRGLRFFRRRP